MVEERIIKLITSLASIPFAFEKGDSVAVFDRFKSCILIIDAIDFLNGHFENYTTLKRVSDLNYFGYIHLVNYEDFIAAYPNSCIEKYINASHSATVSANIYKYRLAYIHLYKLYKSLDTLTRENYIQFIDSFITTCMSEGSDHPNTITYPPKMLYRVLRLRKAVFDMFKKYLNDYDIYKSIEYLHNSKGLSDKEFRAIKKKIRERIKIKKGEAEDAADSSVLQQAA